MSDDPKRYEVEFVGTSLRDLRRIPPRIIPAIVTFIYGDLSRFPRRVGKPMARDLEGLWGARRGPYRVLYEIHDDRVAVVVVNVAHRADIYRPR